MRKAGSLLVVSLLLATLAACGGGSDEEETTPTPEQSEAATPTQSAAEEESIEVDQTFWHAGWKVTITEATLTPGDFGSAEVSLVATFENTGRDEAIFDSQLILTSASNDYTDETFAGHELPLVPGERKGQGSFNFRVDDEFSLGDATLIVGNPDNNQAIVPIGEEGDDLVDLAPREIAVIGSAVAGAVTITAERAVLRADLPDRHSQVEDGSLALTIFFSATPQAGIQIGQGVLQSENVILELPNGTTVAVRSDGVSGVNELLQGREGTTIAGLAVRFEVPEDAEGTYALVLRGKYGAGGADVEGELAFTIEPEPTPTP